jgi:hypothetical protein
MQMQVTWTELWAVIGVVIVLGGILSSFMGWLWQKHSAHDRELAEFKLEVAKNYVTSPGLARIEERLTAAIDRLGEKVERAMEKIAHIAAGDR